MVSILLTDKTAQAEAQAQLDNLKVQYTPIVDQFLLSTGRYKPEEIKTDQRSVYIELLNYPIAPVLLP